MHQPIDFGDDRDDRAICDDLYNRIAIAWELEDLKDAAVPDQDGVSFDPPCDEVFRFGNVVVDAFPPGTPRPRIMVVGGKLSFSWRNSPKWLDLEIYRDGRVRYTSWDHTRSREVSGIIGTGDAEGIRDLILWLIGGKISGQMGFGP